MCLVFECSYMYFFCLCEVLLLDVRCYFPSVSSMPSDDIYVKKYLIDETVSCCLSAHLVG